MDKTSTIELLNFILESIKLIKRRFDNIDTSELTTKLTNPRNP